MAFVFFTLLLVTIFLGVILSSFLGVIPDGLLVGAAAFLTILDLSSPLLLWRFPNPLLFEVLLSSVAAAFPFAC
jgi:hypothetical protein